MDNTLPICAVHESAWALNGHPRSSAAATNLAEKQKHSPAIGLEIGGAVLATL